MTQRLVAIAVEHWPDIDGYAVSRGLGRLEDMPLDRFANFVWWWVTHGADEKERDKFRIRLWRPPKGEVGQGPWSAEAETKAFQGLKQALGK